ncbi:MAG: redoxin domain-containing protein [Acidobacteria bacterium]|nr:redoxin domain-containing protein [Acidobacteriota bacterium]
MASAIALIVAVGALFMILSDDDGGDEGPSADGRVIKLGDPVEVPPIDETTPAFITTEFETFDGATTSLAALRGKPTIVNFWSSTCQACIAEMPDFEEVHQVVGEEITFVGLNTSDREEAADELADRTGVTYLLGRDPDGFFFREIEGLAMPTTLFLDPAGELVDSHAGTLTADQLNEKIDELYRS